MAHLITDPQERLDRIRTLRPGKSILVSSTPPLIGSYPRDIAFMPREGRIILRRLSEREVRARDNLDSLPFSANDELY